MGAGSGRDRAGTLPAEGYDSYLFLTVFGHLARHTFRYSCTSEDSEAVQSWSDCEGLKKPFKGRDEKDAGRYRR